METVQPSTKSHPSPEADNWYGARILLGLLAIPAVISVLMFLRTNSQDPKGIWLYGFISVPVTFAGLSLWFAFKGHNPVSRARMECALLGGLIVGGIAFFGGVVGPLLFMRGSNVGPIIGFIVTGPIGFLAGNVLGAIYGLVRTHKQKVSAMDAV